MKKGFTLIELLVTISVLSFIITITAVSVNKYISIAKESSYEDYERKLINLKDIILSEEILKNDDLYKKLSTESKGGCISVKELINKKYLVSKTNFLKDVKDLKNNGCQGYLKISKQNEIFMFDSFIKCGKIEEDKINDADYQTEGYDESECYNSNGSILDNILD